MILGSIIVIMILRLCAGEASVYPEDKADYT